MDHCFRTYSTPTNLEPVFQVFANNNLDVKINTLFDTGAIKSVMSWKMYQKLNLNDLDTTSIPHVVGAAGESLGTRGRTKCEININGKIFYQTFIVCKHLKRPIILGRDFSIQNCTGISWTKTNTHQLTQNNEVIAETSEYQMPSSEGEHEGTTTILHSSRRRHQHY